MFDNIVTIYMNIANNGARVGLFHEVEGNTSHSLGTKQNNQKRTNKQTQQQQQQQNKTKQKIIA